MSYIGESRQRNDSPWEMVWCLVESDCKLLLKAAEKIAIRAQKNYEKWRDIQDNGEMTERQGTFLMKAEEARENADALFGNIKAFLAKEARWEEHVKQVMEGGDQ